MTVSCGASHSLLLPTYSELTVTPPPDKVQGLVQFTNLVHVSTPAM